MNKLLLKIKAPLLCGVLILFHNTTAIAQTDTLRVLSYNVLYLGDTPPCQYPHNISEGYLATVISYENPDIVGLVKRTSEDSYGSAPAGFADSLLQYSFNAAVPDKFAYCPYTNVAQADNISTLFYNQQKLGYAGLLCTYSNITDFDTYKLYYKSDSLTITHDTIFLYVTLNHTNSGSGSSNADTRAQQITGEMAQIESKFTSLPNMINMGDFNVHTSTEAAYQTLVAPSNLSYRYYDPPFFPDATFTYPADWDANPDDYTSCLTVSTRTGNLPNTCSNDNGGGKSWYDHIFLSANIINNESHISYIPNSFKVIGNDGNRVGNPENGSPANTSAPASVINAIYQISEHYPLTLNLLVNTSTVASANVFNTGKKVTVVNPVAAQLMLQFTKDLAGRTITMTCTDVLGRVVLKNTLVASDEMIQLPCMLFPGIYNLQFSENGIVFANKMIRKQ